MPTGVYSTDILRLATAIPHLGRLDNAAGHESRRAPLCGSLIHVDVDLDEAGRVARFGQVVTACALGQAAASLLGQHIIGSRPEDLMRTAQALALWLRDAEAPRPDWPGLSVFEPARNLVARHGAICLPFEAAAAAAQAAQNGGETASK